MVSAGINFSNCAWSLVKYARQTASRTSSNAFFSAGDRVLGFWSPRTRMDVRPLSGFVVCARALDRRAVNKQSKSRSSFLNIEFPFQFVSFFEEGSKVPEEPIHPALFYFCTISICAPKVGIVP